MKEKLATRRKLICEVKGHIIHTSCDGYFEPSCVFCNEWLPLHPKDKWLEGFGDNLIWPEGDEAQEKMQEELETHPEKHYRHEIFPAAFQIRKPSTIRYYYGESSNEEQWKKMTGETLINFSVSKGDRHIHGHASSTTVLKMLKKGWIPESHGAAGVWLSPDPREL